MTFTVQNALENVELYLPAKLAMLLNKSVVLNIANKEFNDFQDKTGNLGDTVTFDLFAKFVTGAGLVPQYQSFQQRKLSLSVKNAYNISLQFTPQELLFNVDQYMARIGEPKMAQFASTLEQDLLQQLVSNFRINNPLDPNLGQVVDPTSGPYRFYGDGTTGFWTGYKDLVQAVKNLEAFGVPNFGKCGIIPMQELPQLIDNASTKFAPTRNDKIVLDWMLGNFAQTEWYDSNLLPVHYAGNVGESAATLTLTEWNDLTGQNITQLTFSGAGTSDVNAIKSGDLFMFSNASKLKFLTDIGQAPTNLNVQFRATSDSGSDGSGNVTINIYPSLAWAYQNTQNINKQLLAGMTVTSLPTHRAGVLLAGNPFYVAMPRLPSTQPYPSAEHTDADSGLSMQSFFGYIISEAIHAYVDQAIIGSVLSPDRCMRLIFPFDG